MKLDNAQKSKQSFMGSFLTIAIGLTTFMFFYAKTLAIVEKLDVDIMSTLIDNAVAVDEMFTADHGFFIAAALTAYNSNTTLTEEPRYGELVFEKLGWGNEGIDATEMKASTHFCTDEELGIERTENTVMFPLVSYSQAEVKSYRNKFKCINRDEYSIWGDYNSAQAQ